MSEDSGKVLLLVMAPTEEEAGNIACLLLEKRKAACVNIVPQVSSRFWFHGNLDMAQESLLIIKTRTALVAEVTEIVKKAHSYSVPEVVALPVVGGNKEYLDWVDQETS